MIDARHLEEEALARAASARMERIDRLQGIISSSICGSFVDGGDGSYTIDFDNTYIQYYIGSKEEYLYALNTRFTNVEHSYVVKKVLFGHYVSNTLHVRVV